MTCWCCVSHMAFARAPLLLATMALAASFALGWAGALHWPEVANLIGVDQIAQKEAPSPAIAAAKPGGKTEGVQKDGLRARLAKCSTRHRRQHCQNPPPRQRGRGLPPSQASTNPAAVAMATKPSLAPAPETRPTTIPGWTVVEVRDGTAVLEGPEGIKMAARGDTIPGIGRIRFHRALGQPLDRCHRAWIDCDAVAARERGSAVHCRSRTRQRSSAI